ncbi:MAG: response regulator [Lachnospiraceae bacterium]|nr:response regulator [Lachnospiraceae bacterium]
MTQTLQTALVVDDDYLEREYLTELLMRNGFAVRSAASAPNAAAIIKTMRFDCLFIDDRMTGADGAATLQELLRALPTDRDEKPEAYLLGDARDVSAQHFRENGFSHFLEKPVDVNRLRFFTSGEQAPEEQEPSPGEDTGVDRMELLAVVDGLSVETGIANCGSEENYYAALKIFYDTIRTKSDEIEGYLDREEWKTYTIKVHALKSSARIIGATALSEQAAELEEAGNRDDIRLIRDETPAMLETYRSFREKLLPLFAADESVDVRPYAEADKLADAYRSIEEFAEQMDYDLVEMVLHSMEEYNLDSPDAERLSRIRTALLALDWDAIRKEVKQDES